MGIRGFVGRIVIVLVEASETLFEPRLKQRVENIRFDEIGGQGSLNSKP